jgi:hypothetical protein
MTLDKIGNIYILGKTSSTDLPLVNPFKETLNITYGYDHFITIISVDGTSILFSSYMGGKGSIEGVRIQMKLDESNNLYIFGFTYNADFPVANAYDSNLDGAMDAFVMKISYFDRTLVYSTFLGGEHGDIITDLVVDKDENLFLVGVTGSVDFPILNEFDNEFNSPVAESFITKFSSDGQSLLFSTFLGGSGIDEIDFIQIEEAGSILVGGITNSDDFPLQIMNQTATNFSSVDIIFTRISSDGQFLSGSRIGGSSGERIRQMAMDIQGNIYIGGKTRSDDFPLINAVDTIYGGIYGGIYLLKIYPEDQSLLFSTYLDGSERDSLTQMITDDYGNVFLVGSTESIDFPLMNAYNSTYGGNGDCFVVKFSIDFDSDGMTNLWEQKYGLNPNFNDASLDFDSDGMPNLYEFQMRLIPNVNDANGDSDNDGMPNLWEYQMGLLANTNDASEDLDNDGMPNLWEYQNELLVNTSDSHYDKDGDWVSNIIEFRSSTHANNFWSFPLFYSEFPFIISLPVLLFVSVISLGLVGGVAGATSLKRYQKRLLTKQMGINDYETALKMKKGGFTNIQTYKKAQTQNIDSLKEYEFMNELQKTTKDSEED